MSWVKIRPGGATVNGYRGGCPQRLSAAVTAAIYSREDTTSIQLTMKGPLCAVASMLLSVGLTAGGGGPAALDGPVTYSRDIAPILFSRCANCHHPDGPAPFSLVTYGEARQRASLLAAVTSRRYMPPWKPEPGFGAFTGDRRLTDQEIQVIGRWAATGAPEGDPSDRPSPPHWNSGWQIGVPDLVVMLPEYTLGPGGSDVFRNFVVTVPGTGTRYVRGLEFRPDNRAVHHANIRIDSTPASRQLDEADPAPGYEGVILHSADYPEGHFLGWTPGQTAPLASRDMAWRLDAGSDLVVQLHLQPTGKPERIQPAIGLYFATEPPTRTPAVLRLGRQSLDIPAGAADYHSTDSYTLPVDVEVQAVQPHAHYRAREVSAWATLPGGERRWLIRIRNWDFNWQDQYQYASPFWLPAGTILEIEYVFDNSDANPRNPDHPARRASWGWRSSDEMADVWVQVMTRNELDRARLTREFRRKMAAEDAVGCEVLIAREPDHVPLRNDAALLYLELAQPDQALRHFEAISRLQPQSAVARYNVGVALEATGKLTEAASQYGEAVRLDPGYSLAHNNLGNMLLEQGQLVEAQEQYRAAVSTGPGNAEAYNNLGGLLVAFGDIDEAVAYLEEALRLRPVYPEGHFNLARAYVSAGRFDEAAQTVTIAAQEATASGKAQLSAQIRRLIELYGLKTPGPLRR